MSGNNHRHLIVTAFVDAAPTSVEAGEAWLRELVSIVDMEILFDAQALYCEDLGNEGLTGIVGLTTSHASFHAWHMAEKPFVQFDLYSCKMFDEEDVFAHMSAWKMTSCHYTLIDRNCETGGHIVETGSK